MKEYYILTERAIHATLKVQAKRMAKRDAEKLNSKKSKHPLHSTMLTVASFQACISSKN